MHSRARFSIALICLQLAFLIITSLLELNSLPVVEAQAARFSNAAFENVWKRLDEPVAAKRTERSWYWGPQPQAGGLYELYTEAPYGRRLVQYFDKARMEINDPATNVVTNGLLVVELITGRVQQGNNTFDELALSGADVALAGDNTNRSPTYRQLAQVFNKPDPQGTLLGFPVKRLWEGSGPATAKDYDYYRLMKPTEVAVIENNFGVPQAFWDFMNSKGTIFNSGRFVNEVITDWKFSIGLPVSEAYWAMVRVGGVERAVLFQAFERRVLTYTPENPEAYQVEMGNVGLHYVQWRYSGALPRYADPLLSVFQNPVQPQWYRTSEVLNVRTAPSADAAPAANTETRPFVAQLQPGDHLKVLRTVKGQEVEKGFDRWHQIYEKPDLFVYAKYTTRFDMPKFPTPPASYKGLWVAISIQAQMMAIYNNQERMFTTLVATGRKDYETVVGNFRVIGGFRPLSQTMEGGNRASGTGYKLEEVRNVTYFYNDYAIHGSYWHAKYGIAPQSHGCVNATVYDAGLIHQLPVGTPVVVY